MITLSPPQKKSCFSVLFCLFLTFSVHALNVTDMRCEYVKTPLGVDCAFPRLSWKLTTEGSERSLNQVSYRILVGTASGTSDVWDSGIVTSAQASNIVYDGKALESHTTYYWSVAVSDNKGTTASASSTFTTGLYHASDWKGQWIKYPSTVSANQQIWFRKNITLTEVAGRAIAYVASLGNHEFYINGTKVDDRVLAPCMSSYTDRILYVGYDVTSLLKQGQNTVAIWYGPGWTRYEGSSYDHIVRMQMEVSYASGATTSFSTDAGWKCKAADGISSDQCKYKHHGGEIIDANTYDPTWNTTACTEDATWMGVGSGTNNLLLTAQLMPPTKIIGDPIIGNLDNLTTTDSGNLRIFMGKNYVGWTAVKLTGMQKGSVVKVNFCDDNSYITQFDQILTYTCSGKDGEIACNHFNFNGGGYITIEGVTKANIVSITGYSLGNDLNQTGHFTSSDELINSIYDTDLYTYRCSTIEGYTNDCPHRERLGYGEECYATIWGIGFPNYDVYSFANKHIQDWIDVQDVSTGRILNTAPQTFSGSWGGPYWGSAGVNLADEFYRNTGDVQVFRNIYPSTQKWIGFLKGMMSNGLFPLSSSSEKGMYLGDWGMPDGSRGFGNETPAQFFNSCVLCLNLKNAIYMAKILQSADGVDYSSDIAANTTLLNALRSNIHKSFYNNTTGIYSAGTMVQQAFAFFVGVVPDSCRETALKAFKEIKRQKGYLDMGSSGLPILLRYLEEENPDPDFIYKCLGSTSFPGYGYFIKNKGESCWPEFWQDYTTSSATAQYSHIHTCYTGIASWMTKSLAGIRADSSQPGMRNVLIQPYISTANSNLTSASADQTTIYGTVRSSWTRNGQSVTLHCSVPVNSSATIYLPTADISSVTESGSPIFNMSGITYVKTEYGCAIYQVGSGDYNFGFTIPEANSAESANPILIPNSAVDMSRYFQADVGVTLQTITNTTITDYPYYRLSFPNGIKSVIYKVASQKDATFDLSLWLNTFNNTNLFSVTANIYTDANLTQLVATELTTGDFKASTLGCTAWDAPGVKKELGTVTLSAGTYYIKLTAVVPASSVHINGLILTKTGNTGMTPVPGNGPQPVKVYNVMGCLVRTGISTMNQALDNLPAGVYVVNGKKMIALGI